MAGAEQGVGGRIRGEDDQTSEGEREEEGRIGGEDGQLLLGEERGDEERIGGEVVQDDEGARDDGVDLEERPPLFG